MAFVNCSQFKTSQEEQDKRMISAEDELLDKSSGVGGGKVTVEKIKEAIAGDVEVAVKLGSGIDGNGTKEEPLYLNLGETLEVDDTGKLGVNAANIAGLGLVDASGEFALPQYRTKVDEEQAENGNIPVVAPINMGKGIVWNEQTKQYDVALGAGLYLDDNGVIQMRSNEPKIQTFDNGTGTVYHQQAVIDYGNLIEVSGTVNLPLPDLSILNVTDRDDPRMVALNQRMQQLVPNMWVMTVVEADGVAIGLTNNPSEKTYYTEIGFNLYLADLGIGKVISASATAGDVTDFRKETAWVVNDITSLVTYIPVGVHTYFTEGQQTVSLSYTIKGTKR